MIAATELEALDFDGLLRFQALQSQAVDAVSQRLYLAHGAAYARFGPRGREACREDLAFHLEFLRPALEFGTLQPMVDYLAWLDGILVARAIPMEHLALSLDWLGEFFAERMGAADGARVAAALNAAKTKFLARDEAVAAPSPADPWPGATAFEAALLAGRQQEALAIVNACLDDGQSLVDVELRVILPALYQIGEKWRANEVTVAQEHLATAIVQSVMTAGLLRSQPPRMIGKKVLLACVAGNNHAIGLRMVSDGFQLAGWEVQFLGANVPTSALVGHVIGWKPDLVGLSVSFAQQLRFVREVIVDLDDRLGAARPAVIIGGLAINRFGQLAGALGADAHFADAPSAVAYASRFLANGGGRGAVSS
jgi:MerR family transcriptional regulator, light-induced transcriptional regulator